MMTLDLRPLVVLLASVPRAAAMPGCCGLAVRRALRLRDPLTFHGPEKWGKRDKMKT